MVESTSATSRGTPSSVGPRTMSTMSAAAFGAKSEALNVRGIFDLPEDGVVSSLALTPDGCYVFAAFGGGEIRLYAQALGTVGAASKAGTIVAQIRSKVCFVCPEDLVSQVGDGERGYGNWPTSHSFPLLLRAMESED